MGLSAMIPQVHQKLEEAKQISPLEPLKGGWSCQHTEIGILTSKSVRE